MKPIAILCTLLVATGAKFPAPIVTPESTIICRPIITPETVIVKAPAAKPKAERIPTTYRLPGPRNWFRCPHCGSPNCLMFLGDHLRRSHGYSTTVLDKIGYRNLPILHDNLHNRLHSQAPAAATKLRSAPCSTCQGGQCGRPFLERIFGRWR